jgi:predicted component of type VI protein secretion system
MALRLEIISEHRQALADRVQAVFGLSGGAIGRAADNDWVLPDPNYYLSGHHARIHFREDAFVLEDTSTNGVFINGDALPLGRQGTYTVRDGDTLRLGEYLIRASIGPFEEDSGLCASRVSADRVVPLRTPGVRDQEAGDIDASLNLEELLRSQGSAAPPAAPAQEPSENRLQRARAAARARFGGGTPALFDVRSGLQTFCRGAGLDVAQLPPDADSRMLLLAGQLLRETVLGLQEIVRAQRAFQHQYAIDVPAPDVEGPAPDSLASTDFLMRLLTGHEGHELDAVMLLRTYFADARRHDAALRPALREAVQSFLAYLDPQGIASRAASGGTQTGSWDVYGELYRSLTQIPDGQLPHLFAESLAQAYLKSRSKPDSTD